MDVSKGKNIPQVWPNLINRIVDRISHEDNIGHLFIVDIKTPKSLLFNEIYPPIFEKNTKKEPFERSALQSMSILQRNKQTETKSFAYNSKTHSILKDKKFIPLYAEDLHFLIKRAGWLVSHIYEDFTFEQLKFKKIFCCNEPKIEAKCNFFHRKRFFQALE